MGNSDFVFSLTVIAMFFLTYGNRNPWLLSEEFDHVLAYGDGYYLVIKQVDDGAENICSMIGVVNSDAEWIHPLRPDHIFVSGYYGDSAEEKNYEEYIKENTSYIGEGMFLLIRKEICIADRFGHIRRTGKRAQRLGQYSEGLFFADGCFYDIHLRPSLILEGYCIMNEPCFQNGKSSLVIKTEQGEKYQIEMDRRGRLLGKPERL